MNAVEAARAYVKTYFDNDALTKGINSAKRQLTDLGGSMMGVGTKALAAAAPVIGFGAYAVHSFGEAAGALADMSQVTGIGVESLSELSHASTMLGSDIDSLGGALKKQSKFMGDVASGSKTAQATLDRLGLSASDLEGLTGDQQLGVFADALSGIEDQTTKANLAMDVFGGTGTDLLPMLNAGSAGIEAMRQQARDLGVVMSEDAVASGDAFADSMDGLHAQLGALTNGVGAALAPALTALITAITPMITSTIQWVQENGELILTVASIASGVAAAGAALVTLGAVVSGLGIALGGVVTAGTAVVAVVGAIISPVGLAVTAVVALVAGVGELTGAWSAMSSIFGETFGTVLGLLKKGELKLAMHALWVGVKLTWSEGVAYVLGYVEDLVKGSIKLLTDGLLTIADGFEFVGLSGASEELHLFSEELKGMKFDLFENAKGDVKKLRDEMAQLNRLGQPVEKQDTPDPTKEEYRSGSKDQEDGDAKPMAQITGSALSGTFSSAAARQLFSGSGSTAVEAELKQANRHLKKIASERARLVVGT